MQKGRELGNLEAVGPWDLGGGTMGDGGRIRFTFSLSLGSRDSGNSGSLRSAETKWEGTWDPYLLGGGDSDG